jgi:hypothetical protein
MNEIIFIRQFSIYYECLFPYQNLETYYFHSWKIRPGIEQGPPQTQFCFVCTLRYVWNLTSEQSTSAPTSCIHILARARARRVGRFHRDTGSASDAGPASSRNFIRLGKTLRWISKNVVGIQTQTRRSHGPRIRMEPLQWLMVITELCQSNWVTFFGSVSLQNTPSCESSTSARRN